MDTRTDHTATSAAPLPSEPYIYHQDPGHGWLAVPLHQVRALGLTPSSYSYCRTGVAYLEEDCDMSAFLAAFRAHYRRAPRMIDAHSNYDSPIRRYPCYPSAPEAL